MWLGAERFVLLTRRVRYIFFSAWGFALAKIAPKILKAFLIHEAVSQTSPEMKKHSHPHAKPHIRQHAHQKKGSEMQLERRGEDEVIIEFMQLVFTTMFDAVKHAGTYLFSADMMEL